MPARLAEDGCRLWLLTMVADYGCRLWLPTMVADYGCRLWLLKKAAQPCSDKMTEPPLDPLIEPPVGARLRGPGQPLTVVALLIPPTALTAT